jgi:hypothetical protein
MTLVEWYVARSSGIVVFVLSTVAVILGLGPTEARPAADVPTARAA